MSGQEAHRSLYQLHVAIQWLSLLHIEFLNLNFVSECWSLD